MDEQRRMTWRGKRRAKREYELAHNVRHAHRTHLYAGTDVWIGGWPICPGCLNILDEEPMDRSSCPYCRTELRVSQRSITWAELVYRLAHCSDCDCHHARPVEGCGCMCHNERERAEAGRPGERERLIHRATEPKRRAERRAERLAQQAALARGRQTYQRLYRERQQRTNEEKARDLAALLDEQRAKNLAQAQADDDADMAALTEELKAEKERRPEAQGIPVPATYTDPVLASLAKQAEMARRYLERDASEPAAGPTAGPRDPDPAPRPAADEE
jgi:hypothetical protein